VYILKFVSIDPASYRNCGWSVADIVDGTIQHIDAGVFVTADVDELWKAYWPISQFVDKLLDDTKPDLVIVEKTSGFATGFVTGQVSHCMGVIFAACGKYNLNISFVMPTSVKMHVAGHGKVTKNQTKKAVRQYIGDELCTFSGDHAYDSVANILYYLITRNMIPEITEYPWLTEKQLDTIKKRKKQCL
jgi:Holliday junction resolvasome RuvABC endonuclease subunit